MTRGIQSVSGIGISRDQMIWRNLKLSKNIKRINRYLVKEQLTRGRLTRKENDIELIASDNLVIIVINTGIWHAVGLKCMEKSISNRDKFTVYTMQQLPHIVVYLYVYLSHPSVCAVYCVSSSSVVSVHVICIDHRYCCGIEVSAVSLYMDFFWFLMACTVEPTSFPLPLADSQMTYDFLDNDIPSLMTTNEEKDILRRYSHFNIPKLIWFCYILGMLHRPYWLLSIAFIWILHRSSTIPPIVRFCLFCSRIFLLIFAF